MTGQYQKAENRIDRTMNIDGDISFRGTAIVEGGIKGNVTGEMIVVTETGEIIGDLTVEKVVCRGRIAGAITARSVSFGNVAQVTGQLDISVLEVESGAVIDCRIKNGSRQPVKKKMKPSVVRTDDVVKKVQQKEVKKVEDDVEKKVQEKVKQSADTVLQTPPVNPPVSMATVAMSGFFPEGERENISQSIIEAIKSSKEMVKVVGDLGSGKTTICQKVCDGLSGSFKIVRLENVVGSIKEIFQRIAEALNVRIDENSSQTDILEKLKKTLEAENQLSGSVALVLDNSHEMYPATLEGVIKNLSRAYSTNGKIMQIVLFGDEHLDRHLDPKAVDYFKGHPECAFELRPLSKEETRKYIDFKLGEIQRCMNSNQRVNFPDDSAARVYTFSQGVIGKIERIVEEAIELAGKKKSDKIAPKFVKNI